MNFNSTVQFFTGRLYTAEDTTAFSGNWVRLSEVNRLQDELRRLEREMLSLNHRLEVSERMSQMELEAIRRLERELASTRNGLLSQLVRT